MERYCHVYVHSVASISSTDTIKDLFIDMPAGINIYALDDNNCLEEVYNLTKYRMNTLVFIKKDASRGFCFISASTTSNKQQYLYYTNIRRDDTSFSIQNAVNLIK